MKKLLCVFLCALIMTSCALTSFASGEADSRAYWKVETSSDIAAGKTVDVKIYLKADYVTNMFGAVVTYDKTFYEPADKSTESNNFTVASAYASSGNKSVVMSEMKSKSVADKMYDESYTSQMRNKYALAWFSFTFLASKFSSPSTDKIPRFNDFCHVATLKLKVKTSAKGGLIGNVWLDKAYQQKDAGVSTKKYTFVGHANSDIIGKCTNTVKYGQTMDFSDAVLFNSVQMKDVEIQYKSTANVSPTLCTFGTANYSYSYSSSDPSKVSVDKDGNVKGLKQSSAVINCTVTDSNGSAASDSCTVTVKYAWWQWIIVIFLFGWIWY